MKPFELHIGIAFMTVTLVVLAVQAWRKEMLRRKRNLAALVKAHEEAARAQRIAAARLPDGKLSVNIRGVPRRIGQGLAGCYQLVAGGTFGQNQTTRLLNLLYMNGLEQLVGSILLVQQNSGERDTFKQNIPTCFHDRVIYAFSPAFGGGFANRSLSYVMDRVDRWAAPLRKKAEAAAYWHEQWTRRPPAQIIVSWSLGGQAPVLLPVLEVLHHTFPEVQTVAMTSLPRDVRNRQKFSELTAEYVNEHHGLAGWVMTDELLPDWRNADFCVAALVAGLSNAQLYDDEATQLNNTLSLAFTENPGSVLAVQYVHDTLPAYEWRVEGDLLGYTVDGQRLVEVSQGALASIEDGKGTASVSLPFGQAGTSVFDVLMSNVGYCERHQRNDMLWLGDHIEAGYREIMGHVATHSRQTRRHNMLYGLSNYHLKFASLACLIEPSRPACQVVAVRLAAVKGGNESIGELVAVPKYLQLPYERMVHLPASDAMTTVTGVEQ